VRAALAELRRRATPIGVAGFSFGAGPALVAAADVPDVTLVGAFGGYADLRHVIAYVTTGVHTLGDRRFVRAPEPYNRWKLLALLVGFVEDARDREQLQAMAERTLAAPSADVADLEGALGVEGRAVLELIRNRREDAVAGLLARLPASARGALDRLSPLAVVPRLRGRLLIAHGTGDDSIPFTESLRLAAAAPDRARVVVLRSFHHAAGAPPAWTVLGARVLDAWDLFRLADELVGWR
jgi:pimeloyl-ACP methyl ester carboxylesterase